MDFDLVLQGTVVLPDRILEQGYVAVPCRTRSKSMPLPP